MVYAPQRRHAVASFSTTTQALALMQHLYSPNTIVLIFRVVTQMHIRAPASLQPGRSLLGLFVIVSLPNLAAVFFHLLDFAGGMSGSQGLVLDFIGQANPASLTRVLLLDLAIYILQVATLVVCYITNYTSTIGKSDVFPYDDLLLPPDLPAGGASDDVDVETGDQFRQRRFGKGPRYQNLSADASDVWLDDEGDATEEQPLRRTPRPRLSSFGSRSIRGRRTDVPLIFTISLTHLFNLLFRLPPPTPPPRLFSGGTPLNTPPVTPRASQSGIASISAALAAAQARTEVRQSTAAQRLAETQMLAADGSPSNEGLLQPGERDSSGRIPGDYWTTRVHG
ncbi:histone H4-like TAF Taf6, SAGA complex subunit [Vanrija albida]|uniref:Histone H4-like TAF Taf6, SAGA complex subunit n=1 Tax=Vanrija albida TaxID=181172 RepID=A0ABR3PZP8_9TREE